MKFQGIVSLICNRILPAAEHSWAKNSTARKFVWRDVWGATPFHEGWGWGWLELWNHDILVFIIYLYTSFHSQIFQGGFWEKETCGGAQPPHLLAMPLEMKPCILNNICKSLQNVKSANLKELPVWQFSWKILYNVFYSSRDSKLHIFR